MTANATGAGPLAGFRILDLTVAIAGPVATSLLADLGAQVIRVEPPFPRPLHVDIAPPLADAYDHPYNRIVSYNDLHRGKRAMTLDLSKPAGRDVFLQLVAKSDAVVENMSPRVLPTLALGYDDLRQAREDIVLVSMSAFGSDGPLRDRVSYGPGIDAMSGLSWLTGYPDRGPMQPANYYCDYNAGVLAALATIAALRYRNRSGKGQHVEAAMLDGELQVVADALMDHAANGRIQHRAGNAHPTMSPHGVYRCGGVDRWIAIACENDAQWRSLCDVIGERALAIDPRFADVVSRIRNRAEIDGIVSAWARDQDPFHLERRLQASGVPAGALRLISELLADDHLATRRFLAHVEHPGAGPTPRMRAAFTMFAVDLHSPRPAPLYGQDNDWVLGDLLGLTDDRIADLRAERIVADSP